MPQLGIEPWSLDIQVSVITVRPLRILIAITFTPWKRKHVLTWLCSEINWPPSVTVGQIMMMISNLKKFCASIEYWTPVSHYLGEHHNCYTTEDTDCCHIEMSKLTGRVRVKPHSFQPEFSRSRLFMLEFVREWGSATRCERERAEIHCSQWRF